MCTLLTKGNLRAEKGSCHLYKSDVYDHQLDILFIVTPPENLQENFELPFEYVQDVSEYATHLKENLYLGMSKLYQGDDAKRLYRISTFGWKLGIPLVALGDVYYHEPERRELQDVLTCIREKCTIQQAGFRLHANAERYLKSSVEMERLFCNYPEALANTMNIVETCRFSLDELRYVYPQELTSEGRTPQEELTRLVWKGPRCVLAKKNCKSIVLPFRWSWTLSNGKSMPPIF